MTDTITVPLYRLAHGRTGDKGNRSNISVIAWHPELYPILKDQVSEARVAQLFSYREATQVTRYCVDTLQAMNFVVDGVLDGGVNSSLNLDAHGKALSYLLLDLPVSVPVDLTRYLVGPEETRAEVESLQA